MFTLSNINYADPDVPKHGIASLYFIRDILEVSSFTLRNNLKTLNKYLMYFTLLAMQCNAMHCTALHFDKPLYIFNEPRLLNIEIISTTIFQKLVSNDLFKDIIQRNFILGDIKWYEVVSLFATSGANITVSGSAGKRHIICKLDSRFCYYLLAIVDLDSAKLNIYNNFDSVDKSSYLPFFEQKTSQKN